MFMKKIAIFVILSLSAFGLGAAVLRQGAVQAQATERIESFEIFGAEPGAKETDEGRSLLACAEGLMDFLVPPTANFFNDFEDYVRDFLLWPAHYADVAAIENQVNKARYQVISAYLSCDLERLPSIINTYYKLEAEHFFVRHFVDTDGGWLKFLTESPGDRQQFLDQMTDSLIDRIGLGRSQVEKDSSRALLEGYFDEFESKYSERAKSYAGTGEDSVFQELKAKVEELVDTLSSIQALGDELGSFGEEVGEAAVSAAASVKDVYDHPVAALKTLGEKTLSTFQACPSAGHPEECITLGEALSAGWDATKAAGKVIVTIPGQIADAAETVYNAAAGLFSGDKGLNGVPAPKKRVTYDNIQRDQEKLRNLVAENEERAEMLSRYELLYGQVGGSGVSALMGKMDVLLATLGAGRKADVRSPDPLKVKPIQGSLEPLKKLKECADETEKSMCE